VVEGAIAFLLYAYVTGTSSAQLLPILQSQWRFFAKFWLGAAPLVLLTSPRCWCSPRDDESPLFSALTPSSLASFQPQSSSNMELLPVKTFPTTSVKSTCQWTGLGRCLAGNDPHRQLRHRSTVRYGSPDLRRFRPICRTQQRGVWKSGTRKSFLTRLLLSGIIRKQAAVNLIFDMHSEYGWEATSEGNKHG